MTIDAVAYLSLHTSPLAQPGVGSAGGMNVYIDELAGTMASRGVDAVVFTRRTDPEAPGVVVLRPGYRVVHIDAGPAHELETASLVPHVGTFAEGVVQWSVANGPRFDLLHSHYWMSGWAGVVCKEAMGIPLANSFHTLGRIKDLARRSGEPPSGPLRTLTEQEVISRSDCVIASTPHEFDDLLEHYGADPGRLCTSPPGIDHDVFRPGNAAAARRRLGLPAGRLILFVGRIQPLKGLDVAVRAFGMLPPLEGGDTAPGNPRLVVVGGPSGPDGATELAEVETIAARLGVADRIQFVDPVPHRALAGYYQAADLLVMPSRSESFGLVAAEAQACGLPVVVSAVGGLRNVVADDRSGLLVAGHEPADYAAAMHRVLADAGLAMKLSAGALEHAEQFSWSATADRFLELYAGITGK
jgi:D-inositol-3-phosphate glycosyltransferase